MSPIPMLEAELQAQVIEVADLCGYAHYHTHDSRRSVEGFPDLVLVHRETGATLYVELKSNAGRVTPAQDRWLRLLGMRNVALLWRPEHLRSGTVSRVLQQHARAAS